MPPAAAPVSKDSAVVGSYKLVSIQQRSGDEPFTDLYADAPTGYAIITPHRFMAVITAGGRKAGSSVADKAALFDSLIAYTGGYRTEGDRFITEVDISWVASMDGTDQGRTYRIDGDRLILTTDPAASRDDPSVIRVAQVTWQRHE